MDHLEVAVRESRAGTRVTGNGVRIGPGITVRGVLPLLVRRGPAVFGLHDSGDRLNYPHMTDGRITAKQLLTAAAEFDAISGEERYSATGFVRHLLPSISGTPEHERFSKVYDEMIVAPNDKQRNIA